MITVNKKLAREIGYRPAAILAEIAKESKDTPKNEFTVVTNKHLSDYLEIKSEDITRIVGMLVSRGFLIKTSAYMLTAQGKEALEQIDDDVWGRIQ